MATLKFQIAVAPSSTGNSKKNSIAIDESPVKPVVRVSGGSASQKRQNSQTRNIAGKLEGGHSIAKPNDNMVESGAKKIAPIFLSPQERKRQAAEQEVAGRPGTAKKKMLTLPEVPYQGKASIFLSKEEKKQQQRESVVREAQKDMEKSRAFTHSFAEDKGRLQIASILSGSHGNLGQKGSQSNNSNSSINTALSNDPDIGENGASRVALYSRLHRAEGCSPFSVQLKECAVSFLRDVPTEDVLGQWDRMGRGVSSFAAAASRKSLPYACRSAGDRDAIAVAVAGRSSSVALELCPCVREDRRERETVSQSQSLSAGDLPARTGEDARLWSDRFAPLNAGEFCGNGAVVQDFMGWLEKWRRKLTVGGNSNNEENPGQRKEVVESSSSDDDSADDFVVGGSIRKLRSSSSSSSSAPNRSSSRLSSKRESSLQREHLGCCFSLYGPTGCGKTALCRMAALELGFTIVEVHAGMLRSGKVLLQQLSETSQSHSVAGVGNASLIVLEDVDIVFEEDRGFHSALISLIGNSLKPIVLTSSHCPAALFPPRLSLRQGAMSAPTVRELTRCCQSLLEEADVAVSLTELQSLIRLARRDMRSIVCQLQWSSLRRMEEKREGSSNVASSLGNGNPSSIMADWLQVPTADTAMWSLLLGYGSRMETMSHPTWGQIPLLSIECGSSSSNPSATIPWAQRRLTTISNASVALNGVPDWDWANLLGCWSQLKLPARLSQGQGVAVLASAWHAMEVISRRDAPLLPVFEQSALCLASFDLFLLAARRLCPSHCDLALWGCSSFPRIRNLLEPLERQHYRKFARTCTGKWLCASASSATNSWNAYQLSMLPIQLEVLFLTSHMALLKAELETEGNGNQVGSRSRQRPFRFVGSMAALEENELDYYALFASGVSDARGRDGLLPCTLQVVSDC
jgi:hypothetical protein